MRILLADDHALFRQGLERVLEEGFPGSSCGHAGDTAEALRLAKEEAWDLAIVDISFGGKSGLDLLKEIKPARPKLPVLILSMHSERQFAVRALKAGAAGYVTKKVASEELLSAVKRVAAGGRWVTQEVAERLAERDLSPRRQAPTRAALRPRVPRLPPARRRSHGEGDRNGGLGVSVQTVSTYRARILERMRLQTNADLTQYALHHRLIG